MSVPKRKLKLVKFPKKEVNNVGKALMGLARELATETNLEGYFIMGWGKDGRPSASLFSSDDCSMRTLMIPTIVQEFARSLINRSDTTELLDEIFGD